MTLYELTDNYLKLCEMMADTDDAQAVADTMDAITGEIEDKADGYGKVVQNLTAQVKAIKDEEERLAKKRKTIENNIKALKERMQFTMTALGRDKIKTDLFTFSLQNNPPSVVFDDETAFIKWAVKDGRFIKTKTEIAKRELIDAIKNGEEIAGAHIEQKRGLRIK